MSRIGLRHDYINILDDQGQSIGFGGNQMWFSKKPWINIYGQGCGIIAAVDTYLYLTNRFTISSREYKKLVYEFVNHQFMSRFNMKERIKGRVSIGITPGQIKRYLKWKCRPDIRIKAKWNGLNGHDEMLNRMKDTLSNDIPVIWALYRKGKNVGLYVYDHSHGQYKRETYVNSHYVNAIGIIENRNDNQGHRIMIEIASWGKRFFIDYDEYLEYVNGSAISEYCSNILAVRRK